MERILNLGEPKEGLADLQADLLQQSKFPYLLHMSRISRAETDRNFDLYTAGELSDFANTPTVNNYLGELQINQTLALNHAIALEMMNQQVAICKRPLQQQYQALKAIPSPRDGDRRYVLAVLFTMGRERLPDSCFRIQGQLAAAAVGVACERYRQKFGQWPVTLDMIPKDILAEIPIDPFTGKPIVYKRLSDSIAVYTVGPDLTDDGGDFFDPVTGGKGTDFGIEIYDPALRRQPAPLKPVEKAEPEQP